MVCICVCVCVCVCMCVCVCVYSSTMVDSGRGDELSSSCESDHQITQVRKINGIT